MANQNWGVECLKALVENRYDVICVVAHPDNCDPNEKIWYDSVKDFASAFKIQVYQPENVNNKDMVKTLEICNPDIIVLAGYRQIVKKDIISIPKLGCINIHESFLPKYRGHAPTNWSIINGESETGVTVHFVNEGVDTGDIIVQDKVEIEPNDTIMDVYWKGLRLWPKLLLKALDNIKAGVQSIPQNHTDATYFGKRYPEDGWIDWTKSNKEIFNLIRALTKPYPNAFTYYNGEKILILEASLSEIPPKYLNYFDGKYGQIIWKLKNKGVLVLCGNSNKQDVILIKKIQLENGDIFLASDYLNMGKRFGFNCEIEIYDLNRKINELYKLIEKYLE